MHRYTAKTMPPGEAIRERADLLIEARWLLPIAPANTARADHAVAVAAGRIVAFGPTAQLRERFESRERVVRERHALLPGLVNAHTRACHTLLRGLPVHGMSEALLTRVRRVADELDARIAVHLAELAEAAQSADGAALPARALAGAGVQDSARAPRYERPLRQLHALGLLRPGFSAIGAGSCDGADLELLARHGASLIACPQADLRLGAPAPVAAQAAGAPIAQNWRGSRPARRRSGTATGNFVPCTC